MFFYTTRDGWTVYMGRDKYENDQLIAHSFGEDVWFHVDEVSSAHVYLRLGGSGLTIDEIPARTLEECVQLVKAHSISGCKMPTVTVIYTYVSNLRKDQRMDVGTVGFHRERDVHRVRNVRTDKALVKAIEKTCTERTLDDLKQDKAHREREAAQRAKADAARQRAEEAEAARQAKEAADLRCYASVMTPDMITSSVIPGESVEDYEDNFM